MFLPPALVRNVTENWAGTGRHWLDALPALITSLAADWKLTVGAPYALSFHWVAPVTCDDGSPAVLKIGVTDGHLDQEAEALRVFDGHGAARLLAHDPVRGALLLERATPGTMAAALVPAYDEEATAALIGVAHRLHRPPPPDCTLPHLRSYAEDFRAPLNTPLPPDLVAQAAGLFDELCDDSPGDTVLHGDLHHDNVLAAAREPWLAIDPHGLIGDPGFDVGAMLYNPNPDDRDPRLLTLVPARVEQLADGLGMPVDRVVAWGFVMGMLSEVWTASGDATPGSRALDVATLLRPWVP